MPLPIPLPSPYKGKKIEAYLLSVYDESTLSIQIVDKQGRIGNINASKDAKNTPILESTWYALSDDAGMCNHGQLPLLWIYLSPRGTYNGFEVVGIAPRLQMDVREQHRKSRTAERNKYPF